ncbi:uncharacterized protein LOC129903640 [Solanum dulcamara]|uniref:uncharacterized protein LOC129903640 n=1 Tax=Solanum dulcamara TaxID=45834 RepID=UPI0024856E40|nr:uncharacterized protein LOC129903640 [Solanum dulcamara]
MLAQVVANQGVFAPPNAPTLASRVRDFAKINPPEFYGSKVEEDPQEFIDEVYKIIEGEKLKKMRMRDFKRARYEGEFSNARTDGGCSGRSQQGEDSGKNLVKDRVSYPKIQGEGVNSSSPSFPKYAKCGKNHGGKCLLGMGACYGCGKMGHKQFDFPYVSNKGVEGCPQGDQVQKGTQDPPKGSQHNNLLYAYHARQDVEETPNMITGYVMGI